MRDFAGFDSQDSAVVFEEYYHKALELWQRKVAILSIPTRFGVTRVLYLSKGDQGSEVGGPPIVLLHGFGATSLMWQQIMPALAKNRDCYAIDIIGQIGGSIPSGRRIVWIGHYVQWLREIIINLGLEEQKFNLIGYSYGGNIAAHYGALHGSDLDALVLIEPAVVFGIIRLDFLLFFLGLYQSPKLLAREEEIQQQLRDSPYYNYYLEKAILIGLRHFILRRLVLPLPTFLWKLSGFGRHLSVVLAGKSEILHAKRAGMIAKLFIPRAQVHIFPTATHAVIVEHADEIIQLICSTCDDGCQ